MYVIKNSGEKEEFKPEKIMRTCIAAGASKKVADKIIKIISKKIYNGITTKKLLKMVIDLLEKEKYQHVAARYDSKNSILRLGPSGYPFEKFFAKLLAEYGYEVKVGTLVFGASIEHEIDILAEKDKKMHMIECKYHNALGIYTPVRDVLYTYARFLDLQEGFKMKRCEKMDAVWVASNTKFSSDSILYAKHNGIKLTSWKYPKKESIKDLLVRKRLYPITVLRTIKKLELRNLIDANIIFCKDLSKGDVNKLEALTRIPKNRLMLLVEEARNIVRKCSRYLSPLY